MVKLFQGDCLELMKNIPNNSVDLLLTDPPYVLNTKGGGTVNKKMKLSESLADVEKAKIINGYDIELFGQEFLRVMKGINAYFYFFYNFLFYQCFHARYRNIISFFL